MCTTCLYALCLQNNPEVLLSWKYFYIAFFLWKLLEYFLCLDFRASTSIPVSSAKQTVPTQVSAPNDNDVKKNILAPNGSVQSNNTSTDDSLPSHTIVEIECESGSTENILPLHNPNASYEQISSSDEFDFDDYDPKICNSHTSDHKSSKEQLCSESANYEVSLSHISGELVDLVVHCGENIQAQQNSYMQQLIEHERVKKYED